MIFACACFGAYMWSTYVVPETAGVSLEDMDVVFGSEAGQEDSRRKFEVRIVQEGLLRLLILFQLERELGLHDLIKGLVASHTLDQE
jgi:hypothetical protein